MHLLILINCKSVSVDSELKLALFLIIFQIDRATLERTINAINEIYLEAESLSGRTYCESCFACLTAYLAYLCMDTYYEKVLDLSCNIIVRNLMDHEKSRRESSC